MKSDALKQVLLKSALRMQYTTAVDAQTSDCAAIFYVNKVLIWWWFSCGRAAQKNVILSGHGTMRLYVRNKLAYQIDEGYNCTGIVVALRSKHPGSVCSR